MRRFHEMLPPVSLSLTFFLFSFSVPVSAVWRRAKRVNRRIARRGPLPARADAMYETYFESSNAAPAEPKDSGIMSNTFQRLGVSGNRPAISVEKGNAVPPPLEGEEGEKADGGILEGHDLPKQVAENKLVFEASPERKAVPLASEKAQGEEEAPLDRARLDGKVIRVTDNRTKSLTHENQTTETNSKPKELVVIRTHLPTAAQKKRFWRIINNMENRRNVIISVISHSDHKNTTLRDLEKVAKEELIKEFGSDRVSVYKGSGTNGILSSLVAIKRFNLSSRNMISGGVWVISDDIDYTGSWNTLFDKYSFTSILSDGRHEVLVDLINQLSAGYIVSYSPTQKSIDVDSMSDERILFLSSGFLKVLMDDMKKINRFNSQMNINPLSTCALHGCKRIAFRQEDIDTEGFWENNGKFKATKVIRDHITELKNKNEKRLVHPCKW
ncbi:hypothetical protein AAMO2058_000813100 [Amorphochlora amoebiformis]